MMRFRISLPSTALLRPVEIRAVLPYGFGASDPPYRTIWALHCAMGDGDFFFDNLDAADIVNREQVAIIAPSMGNGWFINSAFERQADFLEEMLDALRTFLPLSPQREDNAVVGLSMGGFGAVRWALHSGAFVSVAAISGMFDCRIPLDPRMMKNRAQRAFYTTFEGTMRRLLLDENEQVKPDADIPLLLHSLSPSLRPHVKLYCGDQDYLSLPQSAYLKTLCLKNECPVGLYLSQGGHDQTYWKNALQKAAASLFHPVDKTAGERLCT